MECVSSELSMVKIMSAPIHGQFKTSNMMVTNYAFFNMDATPGYGRINFDAFEGWSGSKVLIPKSEISNKWHDIRVSCQMEYRSRRNISVSG